jgi:AraC-like DNA-binding protein
MSGRELEELDRAICKYLAWCFRRGTPPHVGELARMLGMTPSRFQRHFKRICGENPSRVLKRLQVRRAERLLGQGKSVEQAALRAGFVNQRTIYRAFHSAFGTTPRRATSRSHGEVLNHSD